MRENPERPRLKPEISTKLSDKLINTNNIRMHGAISLLINLAAAGYFTLQSEATDWFNCA